MSLAYLTRPSSSKSLQIAPDVLLAHEAIIEDSHDEEDVDIDGPGLYDATIDFWSAGVMLYEVSLPRYVFVAREANAFPL